MGPECNWESLWLYNQSKSEQNYPWLMCSLFDKILEIIWMEDSMFK